MNNQMECFTYQEIMSQGKSWEATLNSIDSLDSGVVEWLRALNTPQGQPLETLFIGCGSTYYLALSAALFWCKLTGLPARAMPASEMWLYPEYVLAKKAQKEGENRPYLLVAISRSGETSETLRALELFHKRHAGKCLAITCYSESTLARQADTLLLTRMAEEESIAQTRSFTSMYLLMQAIACLVAGQSDLREQLDRTAGVFSPLVEEYQVLIKGLAENKKFERMVYLGSGINYGLACEGMLKMKEMSLTPSEAFHFLEFRHGPKSVVSSGTLIVGLVNETAKTQESQVLAEMRHLGASVLAISETENGLAADYPIALRSGVDYQASRVLTLPLLQLLAYHRAVDKGLNPDRPTNLDAVVRLN